LVPQLFNFLVRDKWDNEAIVSALRDVPTLLISSGKDEMVPAWQMRLLYTARGLDKSEWHFFSEGRHLVLPLHLYESGNHPIDATRLLNLCCEELKGDWLVLPPQDLYESHEAEYWPVIGNFMETISPRIAS
jgi:fermentation-respiration switch protein FrsA (DUF1100 family)